MSSLRAELRRHQKEDAKVIKQTDTLIRIADRMGVKYDELEVWKRREREIIERQLRNEVAVEYTKLAQQYEKDTTEGLIKEFNDLLLEAENWVCLVNILITCLTIHKTWGYTKAINRFMSNWNESMAEIKSLGVEKTMEKINSEFGTDFEFDSFWIEDMVKKAENLDVSGVMQYVRKKEGDEAGAM